MLKNGTWHLERLGEQGRIHGNPVADGWAGAVMRKFKNVMDRPTDGPTNGPTDKPTYQSTWEGVESHDRD